MSLQVIGAGFGRTGTMSLKVALEQLGFGPCYHMVECLPRGPRHWQHWIDAADGRPEWGHIFEGFGATVDFPACSSYRELAAHYPEAKVVLTLRDPEQWFASTQQTIFEPTWIEFLRSSEMGRFIMPHINEVFSDRMHDREHLIERFHEHADEVRRTIPAERLLVFEAADGWAPLCEFLGVPVPGGAYPRVNDTEETKAIIQRLMTEGFERVFGEGAGPAS